MIIPNMWKNKSHVPVTTIQWLYYYYKPNYNHNVIPMFHYQSEFQDPKTGWKVSTIFLDIFFGICPDTSA